LLGAVAKKKAAYLPGTVETLKQACKVISKTSINYTIDLYFKLPQFFQQQEKTMKHGLNSIGFSLIQVLVLVRINI